MLTRKLTSKTRRLVVAAALAGLVLGSAGPAVADDEPTVGAGAGTGWEYVPFAEDASAPCPPGLPTAGFEYFEPTEFVFSHQSTYESMDPADPDLVVASFVGSTITTITIEPFAAAPQGAAPGCNLPVLVPAPVAIIEAEISGTGTLVPGGSVDCVDVEPGGTYTRIGSAVVFDFVVNCEITGNVVPGEVTDVLVRHVIEGNQEPCFPLPCLPDPLFPDPHAGTDQEASSHLETTFEAVGPWPPM